MNYTKGFYHGESANNGYFEGWYFKHRAGADVLAVIPGMSIAKDGSKSAFIQCIHNHGSTIVYYPFNTFQARTDKLYIRVGNSEFSRSEMILDMGADGISGNLRYDELLPVKKSLYAPSMMGPFSYMGFLECYHDVLSIGHGVQGSIVIDNRTIDFTDGRGYIEKDWGKSFPKSWTWLECSEFDEDIKVMAAVADIPFLGGNFTGILCNLYLKGKMHRIATYNGAKVKNMISSGNSCAFELKQGSLRLCFRVKKQGAAELAAPVLGNMCRMIHEYPACELELTVYHQGRTVFIGKGKNAGFEQTEFTE